MKGGSSIILHLPVLPSETLKPPNRSPDPRVNTAHPAAALNAALKTGHNPNYPRPQRPQEERKGGCMDVNWQSLLYDSITSTALTKITLPEYIYSVTNRIEIEDDVWFARADTLMRWEEKCEKQPSTYMNWVQEATHCNDNEATKHIVRFFEGEEIHVCCLLCLWCRVFFVLLLLRSTGSLSK